MSSITKQLLLVKMYSFICLVNILVTRVSFLIIRVESLEVHELSVDNFLCPIEVVVQP